MNYSEIIKRLSPKSLEEQKKIYSGLCSKYNFEKILKGEKEHDTLLLKGILERLGKSPEKFDIILKSEDYNQIKLEEEILRFIEKEQYLLVEKKIKQFEKQIKNNEVLKQQKISYLRTELFFKQKGYKRCYEEIKIAFSYTRKNWIKDGELSGEIWETPMTIIEIKLLQKFIEVEDKLGKKESSYEEAKIMERFLQKFITDKELLPNVYIKTILFLAKKAYERQEYERSVFYCQKGIECLIQSDSLIGGVELFFIKANSMKEGEIGGKNEWKKVYFEACSIESIYENFYYLDDRIKDKLGENLWDFILLEI